MRAALRVATRGYVLQRGAVVLEAPTDRLAASTARRETNRATRVVT